MIKDEIRIEDEIADRLAQAIGFVSDSIPEIARKLEVAKLNVYRYVAKTRTPSLSFCKAFCDVYGVDFDWLRTSKRNTKERGYSSLSEYEKTELLKLISENETMIACYMRNDTDYHEPYVIKRYRHAKGISRKVMFNLLLNAMAELD